MTDRSRVETLSALSSILSSIAGIITATIEIVHHGGTFFFYLWIACLYVGYTVLPIAMFGFFLDRVVERPVVSYSIAAAFSLFLMLTADMILVPGEIYSPDAFYFFVAAIGLGVISYAAFLFFENAHKHLA